MVTLKEFYNLLNACYLEIAVGNINAPGDTPFVDIENSSKLENCPIVSIDCDSDDLIIMVDGPKSKEDENAKES